MLSASEAGETLVSSSSSGFLSPPLVRDLKLTEMNGAAVESGVGGDFGPGRNPDSPSNFMKCFYEADLFGDGRPNSNGGFQSSASQKQIKLEPTSSCYQGFGGSNSSQSYISATANYPGPMFSQTGPSSPMFPQPSPVSGSAMPDSTSFLHYPKQNGVAERRASDSTLVFDDSLNIKSPMTPGAFFDGGTPPAQPMRSHSVSEFGAYGAGAPRFPSHDSSKLGRFSCSVIFLCPSTLTVHDVCVILGLGLWGYSRTGRTSDDGERCWRY